MSGVTRTLRRFARWVRRRPPDFVIGDEYLRRWFVWPRNRFVNLYVHEFNADDDHALHDHPWLSVSVCVYGRMLEHLSGGHSREVREGDVIVRWPTTARAPPRTSRAAGGDAVLYRSAHPRVGLSLPAGLAALARLRGDRRRRADRARVRRVNAQPPTPAECRWCKAPIHWAVNERSRKRMPFDADPDPALERGWELFMRDGEALCRYVKDDTAAGRRLRHPHFETCTNYDPNTKGPADRAEETRQSLERAAPGYHEFFGR